MIKYILAIFALSLISILTPIPMAQAQSTFRFRVFLPAEVDCKAELSRIAIRFQQQTKLQVVGQSCVAVPNPAPTRSDFNVNAGILIYEANAAVTGYPVIVGGCFFYPDQSFAHPSDIEGAYPTYASCKADIANQKNLFEQNLGTEPVAAYCKPDTGTGESYVMVLDSFLQPMARLYVFKAFQGQASDQDVTRVQNLISEDGGDIVRVYQNQIYFYGKVSSSHQEYPNGMQLKSIYAAISWDSSQCQMQLTEIEKILTALGKKSAIAACTEGDVGSAVEIVDKGVGSANFDPMGAGVGYGSYQECIADRARVVRNAQRKTTNIVGGICGVMGTTDSTRQYDVILVTRW